MRKRFEQQLGLRQLPIEATYVDPKGKNSLDQLFSSLEGNLLQQEIQLGDI